MVFDDTEEPGHSVAAIGIHVTFWLSTNSGLSFGFYAARIGTLISLNMSVRYSAVGDIVDGDADVADGGADSSLASLNISTAVTSQVVNGVDCGLGVEVATRNSAAVFCGVSVEGVALGCYFDFGVAILKNVDDSTNGFKCRKIFVEEWMSGTDANSGIGVVNVSSAMAVDIVDTGVLTHTTEFFVDLFVSTGLFTCSWVHVATESEVVVGATGVVSLGVALMPALAAVHVASNWNGLGFAAAAVFFAVYRYIGPGGRVYASGSNHLDATAAFFVTWADVVDVLDSFRFAHVFLNCETEKFVTVWVSWVEAIYAVK